MRRTFCIFAAVVFLVSLSMNVASAGIETGTQAAETQQPGNGTQAVGVQEPGNGTQPTEKQTPGSVSLPTETQQPGNGTQPGGAVQPAGTQQPGSVVQPAVAPASAASTYIISKDYILGLVNAVIVDAVINNNSRLYADQTMKKFLRVLSKGEKVKFLRDKDSKSAYICLKDGTAGWIAYSTLSISKSSYTTSIPITDQQKNLFVNYKGYLSDTKYLIWVNLERQQVNVFLGGKGKWKLLKTIVCSSGKNDTPTISGEFKYYDFYRKRDLKDYYVYNFMRYYDSFAIHSIPFNYNNTINDAELGSPRSHGCIRVSMEDSDWLVKYIPLGTEIVIN